MAVMLGLVGLHQHFPRPFAASGAPGHLGEQLEGALRGAEIGDGQRHIRGDHPHQRDFGESRTPWRPSACR